MSTIKDLFNKNGSIKGGEFDPYRENDTDPRCKLLFDDDGSLLDEAYYEINDFIIKNTKTINRWSDAVSLIYAQDFGSNTKGAYPAIYY